MIESKYSVLMSIYKKENPVYFIKSVESMLNQTLKPDEIVIVKDGFLTIDLDEIIDNYVVKYPRLFNIVSLENNVGLGNALNEGLKACKNELVARMDTDDISVRERCELQVREFEKNKNLSIVGSFIDEFIDDSEHIVSSRVVPTSHKDILTFSKRRNPFNHPTVMYKKTAVLGCNGYKDFRRNQDFELFVRMLNNGHVALNIDKSLVLFRANKDNLKRRKSWVKCKSNISMLYDFWRKGYSNITDLFIVTLAQLIVYISPLWFFDLISSKFLRKTDSSK